MAVTWFVEPLVLKEVECELGRDARERLKRKFRIQVRLFLFHYLEGRSH
jgi:hypothetical protein